MKYTINQLAKLSGVSTRTLRFYDEVDLLNPAFYGDNQYRYYKEEQFLMLQQILFFRELGFPLNDIKKILASNDFNKVKTLLEHKSKLQSNIKRTQTLIKTIDTTVSHLRGKLIMRIEEMFEGFDPVKQQEHEKYMLDNGVISQKQVDESWKRVAHWKKKNWEAFKDSGEQLNIALAKALSNGHLPESDVVQALIQHHYDWVNNFWTPTKETYLGLGEMYLSHPDYQTFYNKYHPDLVEFLVKAMGIYASKHLASPNAHHYKE